MAFQPKKPARHTATPPDAPARRARNGDALASSIADVTRGMPTTGARRKGTPFDLSNGTRPGPPPAFAEPMVQVNFRCSPTMARLIARGASEAGTTRQFLARLLRAAGLPVTEADLAPPPGRRLRG